MQQNDMPSVGKNIIYYRKKSHLSIDELSKRAGVSKSMLSQIEQEKSNPTVATVWKIARALGVAMEKLLESKQSSNIEVTRKDDITVVDTEDGLCTTRINSPLHMIDNLELYQISLKPGGKLASSPHFLDTEEFLTVLDGSIQIQVGDETKELSQGDTARYGADLPHTISNVSGKEATGYLVIWFPSQK